MQMVQDYLIRADNCGQAVMNVVRDLAYRRWPTYAPFFVGLLIGGAIAAPFFVLK